MRVKTCSRHSRWHHKRRWQPMTRGGWAWWAVPGRSQTGLDRAITGPVRWRSPLRASTKIATDTTTADARERSAAPPTRRWWRRSEAEVARLLRLAAIRVGALIRCVLMVSSIRWLRQLCGLSKNHDFMKWFSYYHHIQKSSESSHYDQQADDSCWALVFIEQNAIDSKGLICWTFFVWNWTSRMEILAM